jgi:hypothetical protein
VGQVSTKTCHSPNVQFGLPPARPHKTDVQIWIIPGVSKMQRADCGAFTSLPWPANSKKLILLICSNNIQDVPIGLKFADLLKKLERVIGYSVDSLFLQSLL